jgi:hypothetical protein
LFAGVAAPFFPSGDRKTKGSPIGQTPSDGRNKKSKKRKKEKKEKKKKRKKNNKK